MKNVQQDLPLPLWGGARKGAGRPRKASRPQVPHGPREKFRNAALHVTVRVRPEVWNLRTRRCFQALRQSFERGGDRFAIVEAADAESLARAMKGLQVRMARALNRVMDRSGPVLIERLPNLRNPA